MFLHVGPCSSSCAGRLTLKLLKEPLFVQKRFRYKKKWAVNKATPPPRDQALDHFDRYYKPAFRDAWPSMRAALLTDSKYGALLNNFSLQKESIASDLQSAGALDMVDIARGSNSSDAADEDMNPMSWPLEEPSLPPVAPHLDNTDIGTQGLDPSKVLPGSASLYDFTPATRVLSEREELELELREQSVYEPSALDVHVVSEQAMKFPKHLQMYTYEKGNISTFKPTKPDASKRLGYYLMDAASLLPVLALDLQPHCSVLDMCAAPGGKSLAIMQSLLPSRLVCVDHSYARISRLKSVLRNYLPADDSLQLGGCPQVVHLDANIYCAKSDPQDVFDRVLVDVPCFADRHALYDETNMFQPKRMPERLNIQNLQRKLLFNGILKCRPGGTIVYSTCTLSPPQNDGVIQATIEKLSTETDAQVVIQNTTPIAQSFSETFVFHKCRFGHLVIPNLTANFGPTYFCQLKRTK